MIILDTSFIISLLNSRDVHHAQAVEALKSANGEEDIGTHLLIVQETISVIARKAREQSSDCAVWLDKIQEFFEALKIVDFTPAQAEVLQIMADATCELSYIDSVLVLVNRDLEMPVLTFDNALRRMCSKYP